MLEFSKKILQKVSFDKKLFTKELQKSARWIEKHEVSALKIWVLTSFAHYKDTILEVFDQVS
ncbi:MAG: hypothetical protein HN522_05930 [Flavobacteriales bacterium]|jgi:hypothetical protein|nr:hypothetical protein [Flavobacteriales bacterium]MBT5090242.1 hypothetical protein [Flavobacteriales bacterium]MBT5749768.1 hypothetical protein [Flavobacteriales bacterium]